jgi:hypothetical protein
MSNDHEPINEAMRQAFHGPRFATVDGVRRAPVGVPAEGPAEGTDAAPKPLGKADAGASGPVPTDPGAAINGAIRRALAGRG